MTMGSECPPHEPVSRLHRSPPAIEPITAADAVIRGSPHEIDDLEAHQRNDAYPFASPRRNTVGHQATM